MPTYDYKCEACGATFEKFQSITAAPIKKCPECNKSKVKRLIGTGAGLIFKGSGFYITDYRDSGYKDAAKKESGGSTTETKAGGESGGASGGDSGGGGDKASKPAESKPVAESKPAETKVPAPVKPAKKK